MRKIGLMMLLLILVYPGVQLCQAVESEDSRQRSPADQRKLEESGQAPLWKGSSGSEIPTPAGDKTKIQSQAQPQISPQTQDPFKPIQSSQSQPEIRPEGQLQPLPQRDQGSQTPQTQIQPRPQLPYQGQPGYWVSYPQYQWRPGGWVFCPGGASHPPHYHWRQGHWFCIVQYQWLPVSRVPIPQS